MKKRKKITKKMRKKMMKIFSKKNLQLKKNLAKVLNQEEIIKI